MKTLKIEAPNGAMAVRESAGEGPTLVLIHGNSSSSRSFSRQLDGPLGKRFRLVAVDLPGHGKSDDAKDPSAYSLPGHARAVRAVVDALGLHEARFVGWSLGGHVALEMAPDLKEPRGFVIFGAPPLAVPPAMSEAFLPNPAMQFTFQERVDSVEASAYVATFFKPGFADIPPFFLRTCRARTGGRAAISAPASAPARPAMRSQLFATSKFRSRCCTATKSSWSKGAISARSRCRPCGGARCRFPGAGHAPQWETPEAFDAIVEAFVKETT